jgi:predicted site-specific integrase-resolvase
MPTTINGKTYYRTAEVCQKAGISRTTFFRWLREGVIEDNAPRDRRGWRLFTEKDLRNVQDEASRIEV